MICLLTRSCHCSVYDWNALVRSLVQLNWLTVGRHRRREANLAALNVHCYSPSSELASLLARQPATIRLTQIMAIADDSMAPKALQARDYAL